MFLSFSFSFFISFVKVYSFSFNFWVRTYWWLLQRILSYPLNKWLLHRWYVSFFNLENHYNWIMCPKVKDMICNWIDLKVVIWKLMYHWWKIFIWLLELEIQIDKTILVFKFSKFYNVEIVVGFDISGIFRKWMKNVLIQCLYYVLYLFIHKKKVVLWCIFILFLMHGPFPLLLTMHQQRY